MNETRRQSSQRDSISLPFRERERVALEFATLAARLIHRGHRELRDQLPRASLSVPLNMAESCGRRSPADKAYLVSPDFGSRDSCLVGVEKTDLYQ
jgi:hypothetical protein